MTARELRWLPQNGRRSFGEERVLEEGESIQGFSLGDIDRDGRVDLVLQFSTGDLLLRRGLGGGTFAPYTELGVHADASALVDVRGDALSVVIIDKLPFAPPDDPVLAARIAEMEKRGLNGFMNHQLPEAIINLKQGAGRLIRDENDRGVLMICDSRLNSKPYGRRIWQSLPPFKRTREIGTVQQFLSGSPISAETET